MNPYICLAFQELSSLWILIGAQSYNFTSTRNDIMMWSDNNWWWWGLAPQGERGHSSFQVYYAELVWMLNVWISLVVILKNSKLRIFWYYDQPNPDEG